MISLESLTLHNHKTNNYIYKIFFINIYNMNYENDNNIINKWRERKLKTLCEIISCFVSYITIPRKGYSIVKNQKINYNIVKFVVEEVLNCDIVKTLENKTTPTEEFIRKINSYKKTKYSFSNDALVYIWKYIECCSNELTIGISYDKEFQKRKKKAIKTEIETMKDSIMKMKNDQVNNKPEEIITSKVKNIHDFIKLLDNYINNKDEMYFMFLTNNDYDMLTDILNDIKIFKRLREYTSFINEVNNDVNTGKMTRDKMKEITKQVIEMQKKTFKKLMTQIKESNNYKLLTGENIDEIKENDGYINIEKKRAKNILNNIIVNMENNIKNINNDIDNNNDIIEKTKKYIDMFLSARINNFKEYIKEKKSYINKFNDLENCFVQCAIYLIIAFSDWFEINEIGKDEVMLFGEVIFMDIKNNINNNMKINKYSDNMSDEFIKHLNKNNLNINEEGKQEIKNVFNKFLNMKKNEEIINRVKFYCN